MTASLCESPAARLPAWSVCVRAAAHEQDGLAAFPVPIVIVLLNRTYILLLE
jgi:hypothetical protein